MNGRLELGIAACLVVAGLVSVGLQLFVFVDPTTPADWERAGAWVTERIGPNDVVRVEPVWHDGGLVPLQSVGDQVDRVRTPLNEDLYAYDAVFIVSETNRVRRALEVLPFPAKPTDRETFDSVTAMKVEVPENIYSWELYHALGDAKVSRVLGEQVERCDRWNERRGRWDCAKPNRWLYVARETREVGDEPRRCVYAHPLDGGRTLRIEAEVPPSDTIRVRDSFSLRAARLPRTGEVLMQVFVNDELKVEDRVAHDDHGYEAHDIDVSSIDGPVQLRIEVDLIGSIKDRYFCLNAWAS